MSQENVEVVRRLYSLRADAAGIVRGDFDEVFLDYMHPDVEVVPPSTYPDADIAFLDRSDALEAVGLSEQDARADS